MTREEAIAILDLSKLTAVSGRKYDEAVDMAIEALSREQKKYDAICDELLELKRDLNLPIEVAMAYEKSIGIVRKYAKMGGTT